MKTNLLTILTLGAALALVAPAAALPLTDGTTATVTLEVDYENYPVEDLQGFVTCDVTVPTDSVVADVLNQATVDGCISGWTWIYYASTGTDRFVTGVDGRQADCNLWATWLVGQDPPTCTYWTYEEDGEQPDLGVDGQTVSDGSTYTFLHNDFFAESS